jgi:pyroglutamyl-peptidase
MMKTVLLTGFDPFGGAAINPAWEAVRQLEGWSGDGFIGRNAQLPCVFGRAAEALCGFVDEIRPDIVIASARPAGVPRSRSSASPSTSTTRAIPRQRRAAAGRRAHRGGRPGGLLHDAADQGHGGGDPRAGHQGGVSQTAGTFVCNHVFYALMHHLRGRAGQGRLSSTCLSCRSRRRRMRSRRPAMTLEEIVAGLRVAVEVALAVDVDVAQAGGATQNRCSTMASAS